MQGCAGLQSNRQAHMDDEQKTHSSRRLTKKRQKCFGTLRFFAYLIKVLSVSNLNRTWPKWHSS